MFARRMSKSLKFHLSAAIGLIIAVAVFAPPVYAKLSANTVDPVATVSRNGRHIRVTGPISCDQTQPVQMRVTVTQRSTGAMAEGYLSLIGTTVTQQWWVQVDALGNTPFAPGPATVVALARSTTSPGHPDDAHQWLVNVTLVQP